MRQEKSKPLDNKWNTLANNQPNPVDNGPDSSRRNGWTVNREPTLDTQSDSDPSKPKPSDWEWKEENCIQKTFSLSLLITANCHLKIKIKINGLTNCFYFLVFLTLVFVASNADRRAAQSDSVHSFIHPFFIPVLIVILLIVHYFLIKNIISYSYILYLWIESVCFALPM